MASRESGLLEGGPEQSLATKRPRPNGVGSPPRSFREQVPRIVAVTLTCAVLVGLSIALADRPVATWVHEHLGSDRFGWFTTSYFGPPLRLNPFSLMASPALAVGLLAAFVFAILAIASVTGWRPEIRGRIVLALCVSAFAANEIDAVVKGVFGRTWPESWLGNNPSWIRDGVFGFFPFHGGPDWASFPSGHTAVITATATVLWVILPELKVAWAALVAVVVVGLIAGNYHFVSDVIAGLYLGAGVGLGAAGLLVSQDDRIVLSGRPNRVRARHIDRGADPPTSVEVGSRTVRACRGGISTLPSSHRTKASVDK